MTAATATLAPNWQDRALCAGYDPAWWEPASSFPTPCGEQHKSSGRTGGQTISLCLMFALAGGAA